ncbi:MAG TPA: CcdC protein domain-containing protein [Ktedonobacteraceae bacterium]|nr:CcdC protein domain-containing protein [Ktedonobacteraceae bacterium]
MIVTAVLALVIVVFIFARQIIQRRVTQRSLLLPLILSVALGGVFLVDHPALEGIAAVIIGTALGVGTGLVSGQLIRVWRDEATGTVFQRGGWLYLIVLIALLLARVLIRFLFTRSGSAVDETALNAALIAALVGNFLGRDIHTALRALQLSGGSFTKLFSRSITP